VCWCLGIFFDFESLRFKDSIFKLSDNIRLDYDNVNLYLRFFFSFPEGLKMLKRHSANKFGCPAIGFISLR
jgi:hypothetical protein